MPGPIVPVDKLEVVRLKSKMHHTEGAETLEEAREHLADLASKVELPEGNVWDGEDQVRDVAEAGPDVMVAPNWKKAVSAA